MLWCFSRLRWIFVLFLLKHTFLYFSVCVISWVKVFLQSLYWRNPFFSFHYFGHLLYLLFLLRFHPLMHQIYLLVLRLSFLALRHIDITDFSYACSCATIWFFKLQVEGIQQFLLPVYWHFSFRFGLRTRNRVILYRLFGII